MVELWLSNSSLFFNILFTYFHVFDSREKQRQTGRQRDISHLLVHSLNALGWARPTPAAWNSDLRLSHWWHRPKCMSHHLLPLRVCISRKLGWKQSQDADPGTQVGYGCPKQHPKCSTKMPTPQPTFSTVGFDFGFSLCNEILLLFFLPLLSPPPNKKVHLILRVLQEERRHIKRNWKGNKERIQRKKT